MRSKEFNDDLQRMSSTGNTHSLYSFLLNPVVIACGLTLLGIGSLYFDTLIADTVRNGNLPGDVSRILDVSEFFAHGFGVVVIMSGIWILVPQCKRFIPRMLFCAFGAGLAANLIKFCVGRFRPVAYVDEMPQTITDSWCGFFLSFNSNTELSWSHPVQSFPSAHAATAFGLAVALGWLFPKGKYYFLCLATLASAQRIVSLAHWTSDTFIGAAVGILVAQFIISSKFGNALVARFEKVPKTPHQPTQLTNRQAA
jgi:membrane-associated phospholipid phosphatase